MKDYKKLLTRYPLLFKAATEEGNQSPFAHFGFECDVGWYDIIDCACGILYSKYWTFDEMVKYWEEKKQSRPGPEDDETIEKYKLQRQQAIDQMPVVSQIKEKFGGLRFYVDNGNENVYAVANYAEALSYRICEVCGNTGKTYRTGWHKTLCPKHATEKYGEKFMDEELVDDSSYV